MTTSRSVNSDTPTEPFRADSSHSRGEVIESCGCSLFALSRCRHDLLLHLCGRDLFLFGDCDHVDYGRCLRCFVEWDAGTSETGRATAENIGSTSVAEPAWTNGEDQEQEGLFRSVFDQASGMALVTPGG